MYFFAKMCRLCLGGDCELNKLLSCDQTNNSLLNKLSTMFPKLDSVKTLPPWICLSCKQDLNAAYKFYLRCLNAHNKLEEYYDLNLKSSLLVNDKKTENYVNMQIINPKTETCENNENLMSFLLTANSSDITIKKEIEDVAKYTKLSEANNSNLVEYNLHKSEFNEELLKKLDNIVEKTERTNVGDENSEYNLNKPELNIDDEDFTNSTENDCGNYSSSNIEEVSATTIFERNASVTEDSQLFCNDIQNSNKMLNLDNSSTLIENALSQTFSVESSDRLKLKMCKNVSNGNNHDLIGERYQCHFCTIAFTMEIFLERHLKRIHGYTAFVTSPVQMERIENTIPLEPKKYKYSQREKISTRPIRYKCLQCGKGFSDRSQLRIHHRIHTGERPFTCQTCNKSFNQKQHLKLHLRTHTNERPFVCDICNKSFSSRYINVHKRIHTGELPFACPICNERFNRTDKVNKHIRIKHTKEKPYLCIYCDKTFNDRSLLTRHRYKYHPDC